MRGPKIAGWAVAAVLIIVAGGVAALWLGGGPVIAWALEHPVSSAIGRQIRIAGPLTIQWGSPTRLVAENVHLANAGWGSAPPSVTLETASGVPSIFAVSMTTSVNWVLVGESLGQNTRSLARWRSRTRSCACARRRI